MHRPYRHPSGIDEVAAVSDVVTELGGEPNVEVVTCHQESDLDAVLNRRAGRTVVVVGGDGSLHTLLRHLWRRGEAGDCTVGLVPLGTGNDFARGVGIPLDHRRRAWSVPANPGRWTSSWTTATG